MLVGVLAIVDNASAVLLAIFDTVSIPEPIACPTGVKPPTGLDCMPALAVKERGPCPYPCINA